MEPLRIVPTYGKGSPNRVNRNPSESGLTDVTDRGYLTAPSDCGIASAGHDGQARREHEVPHTLTPLIARYLKERVATGEIIPASAKDAAYELGHLDRSFGNRPLNQLTEPAIQQWRESIGHLSEASRRHYASTTRGFIRWLVDQDLIRKDPTRHVRPTPQPRRTPVTLKAHEVGDLIRSLPDARARAIVWLMVGCGLRCVEVSRLRVQDFDPLDRTLHVVGKAKHERTLPVPAIVCLALASYLDTVGRTAGPLIRSDKHPNRPLSPQTLSIYVSDWMKGAGVKACQGDGRSAHGLRRTAASDVMEACKDVRLVQLMMGHADPNTTVKLYIAAAEAPNLRSAMEGRTYEPRDDGAAA